ncbi:hypothetical protein [Rhizobium lentis]|uniref:hypothetical protein n=1 Tax=Rhizobium lentis TaxID=1138194 RepID=UPI002180CFDA|nr:hypothetical protein [Rhizobium lentis]
MPFNTAQVTDLGKASTASDIILKFIRDSVAVLACGDDLAFVLRGICLQAKAVNI